MAFINWNDIFYVDPTTGEAFETGDEGLIPVPTYGTYGGAFNPEPGTELPTNGGAIYGSFDELQAATDDSDLEPVDWSDYYYYVHDLEIRNADTLEEQATADIKLITSLTFGDSSYANDPEATFYDGIATLGLLGRLAVNDQVDIENDAVLLAAALVDSAADIEYGLDNFSKKELNVALDTLFETSGKKQYSVGFEITTQTFFEEVTEATVINAAALALNESNDPRVNTISWPSIVGTSEYALLYDRKSHDLDLISL